mmetsp:Transcript_35480/g.80729  ORF Transcript_35480/g.80729 Transcript_35480/m.80729 type:complete len:352 (-) Transcript_35480:67-1122(-)
MGYEHHEQKPLFFGAHKATPEMKTARTQSLVMPWYEVASEGDGISPENVAYWRVPPTVAPASQTEDLAGFPAPPNNFQDPTVWNGDHVLNGGNKEWSEEDAALHAYNMQRWRNKILNEQIDHQDSQWELMNRARRCDETGDCGSHGAPAARATADVRMSQCDGKCCRLEVRHNDQWGTVCDDSFGSNDATVACRSMGQTGSGSVQRYGGGVGLIWMDNMNCNGGGNSITECNFNGWGNHNCGHGEDVGICCNGGMGGSASPVSLSGNSVGTSQALRREGNVKRHQQQQQAESKDEIAAELKALANNANKALDALGGEPLTARGAQTEKAEAAKMDKILADIMAREHALSTM